MTAVIACGNEWYRYEYTETSCLVGVLYLSLSFRVGVSRFIRGVVASADATWNKHFL